MHGPEHLDGSVREIADRIVREIANRLEFLVNVGLDYLALDRAAGSLSGGESQRLKLAAFALGSALLPIAAPGAAAFSERHGEPPRWTALTSREGGAPTPVGTVVSSADLAE